MTIQWLNPLEQPEVLKAFISVLQSINHNAYFNWSEESFLAEIKISKTFVIKFENLIKGFLLFREGADCLEIMILGTCPDFQKKGAMRSLVSHLKNYAARQGKGISLEVHEMNKPARQLYLDSSFELSYKRKNYYKDGAAAEVFIWKNKTSVE